MTSPVAQPKTMRFGLRFQHADLPKLRLLANRVRQADATLGVAGLVDQAIKATEDGDAMQVLVMQPDEAHEIAAVFVIYGISMPTIEKLRD